MELNLSKQHKPLRCPMGVPGGIISAIIGLIGVVISIVNSNWTVLPFALALLLLGLPLARVTMLVHTALDKVTALEDNNK